MLMGIGTIVVLLFSDPMYVWFYRWSHDNTWLNARSDTRNYYGLFRCDILSQLGYRLGIDAFYISFVLAPLASNASEVIASFKFAKKKTKSSITVSFTQVHCCTIQFAEPATNSLYVTDCACSTAGGCWDYEQHLLPRNIFDFNLCTGSSVDVHGWNNFNCSDWIVNDADGSKKGMVSSNCTSHLIVSSNIPVISCQVHTLCDGFIVLAFYPLSIAVVVILETVVGLD